MESWIGAFGFLPQLRIGVIKDAGCCTQQHPQRESIRYNRHRGPEVIADALRDLRDRPGGPVEPVKSFGPTILRAAATSIVGQWDGATAGFTHIVHDSYFDSVRGLDTL